MSVVGTFITGCDTDYCFVGKLVELTGKRVGAVVRTGIVPQRKVDYYRLANSLCIIDKTADTGNDAVVVERPRADSEVGVRSYTIEWNLTGITYSSGGLFLVIGTGTIIAPPIIPATWVPWVSPASSVGAVRTLSS